MRGLSEPESSTSPWAGTVPVVSTPAGGTVTLVEGQTFSLSSPNGDIDPELPHGVFEMDTRILSCLTMRLNGHVPEPLAVDVREPFSAVFVSRGHPAVGHADADVLCFRHRRIGGGLWERIGVTNHGLDAAMLDISLHADVDFATLFEVKEGRVLPRGVHRYEAGPDALRFGHEYEGTLRAVTLSVDGDRTCFERSGERGRLEWQIELHPRETWWVEIRAEVDVHGHRIPLRHTTEGHDADLAGDDPRTSSARLAAWRREFPRFTTDAHQLDEVLERTREDLGSLRIADRSDPQTMVVAAGAPWFMTLFGRDSIITASMALFAAPSLAHGVLRTLARRQGARDDPDTEEEPGKILHEVRFDDADTLALGGGAAYYGSVDATPLFVMLLDQYSRWHPEDPIVDELWPAASAALRWIDEHGDADGDGYVEYQRRSAHGLANQGWKDSWDAIRWSDGTLAEGPIALCEVQGYVYAALLGGARLAIRRGDPTLADTLTAKASTLRERFNRDFWIDGQGFALALDGDKRPVDAVASNIGHCLWTGIVDRERAPVVAQRLLSPTSFSGWGIRTLDTTMRAYNPVSYHNGSVWPHDNALAAAGLARYGFHDEAHAVIRAQLDVAERTGGRLPELFAGFDRDELGVPAAYPTSCSPQAWASASPLLWLSSMLGFDPDRPDLVDPHLPPWLSRLRIDGVRCRGERLDVSVHGGRAYVDPSTTRWR